MKQSSRSPDRTWWAPGEMTWWTGILFAVGATCFALGAAPGYAHSAGSVADSLTFFVGSIFFTGAAFLQFLGASRARRILHSLDWWACLVQLAGTIFFNLSTFKAMQANLSVAKLDHLVWRPDAYGSVCFLVASALAWMAVNHRVRRWEPGDTAWRIAALNLLGSVAFGVSALADYTVPTTGSRVNVILVNLGTFTGALCFLAGAILLLPRPTRVPTMPA
jgi:hypothetical protein